LNFVEACRKMISFDSSPQQGTRELVTWLAELAQSRGLHVEVQEEFLGDQPQANILIRPTKERPALELLLQTHLDTPDPGPFGFWAETGHNPFDATIIDNKIYGLGAADVKLDFLCKLEALSGFAQDTTWRLPPVLVGTYGEELGMVGALKVIRKNKVSAKMALVGEPSDLQPITAGKGIATVEIRIPYSDEERQYRYDHNLRESTSTQSRIFSGKAAHSSTPHLGESALKKMFDYLLQLPENIVIMEVDGGVNFNTVPASAFLEIDPVSSVADPMSKKLAAIYRALMDLETQFLAYQDRDFNPSHPTLNVGLIRTFEDHVFLSGSCRIPPIVTNEIYEAWMTGLRRKCESFKAEFRVTDYKRPYRSDDNSIFVRGCVSELKEMGLSARTTTQSSSNEASLWSRTGIECISFGPGIREGNIHTPKEHVQIDDLKKAIEFYRRVIGRFCL
jgi:acetylornithine deacetylase/succinyl-diaminopimelate desuccinylase-like protein